MKLAISTRSVAGLLKPKLTAIADAGFEGVELAESDLLCSPYSAEYAGAMLRELGLSCVAFAALCDFEGLSEEERARGLRRAEHKFDLMQDLGADLLVVTATTRPDSSDDDAHIVADLRELGTRAATRGMRIAYEPVVTAAHVKDHRRAARIVAAVAHPAVGLAVDTVGLARDVRELDFADFASEKIFHVEIADLAAQSMGLEWASRHHRLMPGQGDLPLRDFVAWLDSVGYEGPLSLEVDNDLFCTAAAERIAVDGMRALTWLIETVQTKSDARIEVRNVEFLEFCANDAEAPRLEHMLRTLGFVPVGRHRRKRVTRWRQGEINLVINCDPDGFARSFDVAHGVAACAVGLRVPDPAAALVRAASLQIATFSQSVAPGEYPMPAVLGVGDSLVYFMPEAQTAAIWDSEFEPLPVADTSGAGLRWIDHFTQVTRDNELASWLLFYVAMFRAGKTRQIEVPDPVGRTISQAIDTAGGRMRVVLNAPQGEQTLASRFIESAGGAGVQQIAFATDDIFATAERLAVLGVETLQVPANYYAALTAEFGLTSELVQRLAAHHILYDRDAHGEYFQIVTRALAKRFFFEIVERRGYMGHGEANVPVQLAAQSRYRNLPPTMSAARPLG
jgi:4-hydroxyphenylpyruvate dioxygenase